MPIEPMPIRPIELALPGAPRTGAHPATGGGAVAPPEVRLVRPEPRRVELAAAAHEAQPGRPPVTEQLTHFADRALQQATAGANRLVAAAHGLVDDLAHGLQPSVPRPAAAPPAASTTATAAPSEDVAPSSVGTVVPASSVAGSIVGSSGGGGAGTGAGGTSGPAVPTATPASIAALIALRAARDGGSPARATESWFQQVVAEHFVRPFEDRRRALRRADEAARRTGTQPGLLGRIVALAGGADAQHADPAA